MVIIAVTCNSH